MAIISGYTSLLTAVGDYLGRSDLTSFTPNFVQNWEERFYRQPENWARWMENSLSVTVASGVAALPTGYLGLASAYVSGVNGPPLKRVSLEQLYARYPRSGDTGVPMYIARNGSNFEFGPISSDGYVIAGTYYRKPTLMRVFASDADAHWLIVNAPDLVLYGALLEATPFLIDDKRLMVWKSMYDEALASYRTQHVEENYHQPFTVAL